MHPANAKLLDALIDMIAESGEHEERLADAIRKASRLAYELSFFETEKLLDDALVKFLQERDQGKRTTR